MIRVILASYNGEKYIEDQITSIMNQSMDVSLHIYDDCSVDGTVEIIKKAAVKYPGKIDLTIRTENSKSPCINFLKAVKEEEPADYYLLADQDDVWEKNKVAKLYEKAQNHMLVFSDAKVVDENLMVINKSFKDFQKLSPERIKLNQLLVLNQVTGGACMFNYRLKEIVTKNKLPEEAVMHDHYLALLASCFGDIAYVDEPLYLYRQHNNNRLGARKSGFIRETMKRMGLGGESKDTMDKKSKESYERIFRQAGEFRKLNRDMLSKEQLEIIDSFVAIKEMNRIQKIKTIIRYDFTFNTFYRTAGEFLFI